MIRISSSRIHHYVATLLLIAFGLLVVVDHHPSTTTITTTIFVAEAFSTIHIINGITPLRPGKQQQQKKKKQQNDNVFQRYYRGEGDDDEEESSSSGSRSDGGADDGLAATSVFSRRSRKTAAGLFSIQHMGYNSGITRGGSSSSYNYNNQFKKQPSKRQRRRQQLLQQQASTMSILLARFLRKWTQFRQLVHRLLFRTTVYVLALEGDRYYVGSTTNPKRRFREHFDNPRSGSRWTRIHRPLRVEALIRRVPARFLMGVEAQVTAEYMLRYGVNQVRGAYFTHPRNYTLDDVDILTAFMGHYGNLDFKMLEKKLQVTLPPPSPAAVRRSVQRQRLKLPLMSNNLLESQLAALRNTRRQQRQAAAAAFAAASNNKRRSGRVGHWANDCSNPADHDDEDSDEMFLQSVLNG